MIGIVLQCDNGEGPTFERCSCLDAGVADDPYHLAVDLGSAALPSSGPPHVDIPTPLRVPARTAGDDPARSVQWQSGKHFAISRLAKRSTVCWWMKPRRSWRFIAAQVCTKCSTSLMSSP